jgi:hypothetical protein
MRRGHVRLDCTISQCQNQRKAKPSFIDCLKILYLSVVYVMASADNCVSRYNFLYLSLCVCYANKHYKNNREGITGKCEKKPYSFK